MTSLIDYPMRVLSEYLAQELNLRFYPTLIVKTWRDFNALREPLSNLPVLKCYRERDTLIRNTPISRTDVIIEYDVVYPKDSSFSKESALIGHAISDLLIHPKFFDVTGLKMIDGYSDTSISYGDIFSNDYQATVSKVMVRTTLYTYLSTNPNQIP